MRRILLSVTAVCFVAGFIATPVASAQQSVNLWVGAFAPTGIDARDSNDVLVQDQAVLMRLQSLSAPTFGGSGLSRWVPLRSRRRSWLLPAEHTGHHRDFVDRTANVAANFKLRVVRFRRRSGRGVRPQRADPTVSARASACRLALQRDRGLRPGEWRHQPR